MGCHWPAFPSVPGAPKPKGKQMMKGKSNEY